jgi:4-hydroxy-2-oxoheptanedioate aldolase
MQTNTTKAKLKAGETVCGCFVRTPDASLIEFLGYQGWDFIIFDGEHGTLSVRDCEDMTRAAELRGVTPLARVTVNQPHIVLRFLDTGVLGVHVPWVNSGVEAEAAVQAIKYHPRGVRGLGGVRATTYGQTMNYGEYVQKANAETLTVIHIETVEAVNALPDILAVKDVDVIFIGPTDLSHSLGVPGQSNHPAVQEQINRILDLTLKTDVAVGTITKDAAAARQWRERGARYLVTTLEGILGPACREYLKGARG